jgi:hypothetical protein
MERPMTGHANHLERVGGILMYPFMAAYFQRACGESAKARVVAPNLIYCKRCEDIVSK